MFAVSQNSSEHIVNIFNLIAGGEDWGGAVCHWWEPEAAGDLWGEGKEEGGEVPGAHQKKQKYQMKRRNTRLNIHNSIASLLLQKALNRLRIYQINRIY